MKTNGTRKRQKTFVQLEPHHYLIFVISSSLSYWIGPCHRSGRTDHRRQRKWKKLLGHPGRTADFWKHYLKHQCRSNAPEVGLLA